MNKDTIFNILLFVLLILLTISSFVDGMYVFGTMFLFLLIWATSCIKITKIDALEKEGEQ